jgi:arylsulfatase A-like enzyme
MFRRNRLATFVAGLCLSLAWASLPAAAAEPKRPPNFLIVIADDLGWHDIGYHGSDIRTPHLDRLAQAGVRLERHYVCPTCSPTRAGLLTGRNPSRFGIHGPIDPQSKEALPQGTLTLARLLQGRGYATALCGKWHLTLRPEDGPRRFGFDRTYGYFHGQIDPYTHRYKTGERTWHRNDVLVDEKGHATDLIAEEAVRFLAEPRQKPFFLYVAFSVPHHPLAEEEQWLAPYQDAIRDPSRRLYAASVTHLDAAVGRLVAALEKSGQFQDTMILFTSDNGGQRDFHSKTQYEGKYDHPVLGNNRPLRGWKAELYEGGIRVPAFVFWPGRLQPAVVRQTVSYLDWFPTMARLAGAGLEAGWKLEGRDIWPLLTDADAKLAAPTLYWNTGPAAGVLLGDWKLIVSQRRSSPVELYNLAEDPAETKNQASTNAAKVHEMRQLLAAQKKLDP